jgi:hypothetical protein
MLRSQVTHFRLTKFSIPLLTVSLAFLRVFFPSLESYAQGLALRDVKSNYKRLSLEKLVR